jgi:hypothetical protein
MSILLERRPPRPDYSLAQLKKHRLVRRLRYNISPPSRTIEYIGCNAVNLGDQAVYWAVDQTFPGVTVCYSKWTGGLFGALGRYERQQKRLGSMLGGGTIIGAPPWSRGMADRFEESLDRTGRGFAFGTGVQELIFPPDHEAFVEDPSTYEKWARLLKQCEYVGVRGPRSQIALAEMGVASEVIGDPACALVRPEGFWQPRSGHLGINTGNGGGSLWGDRDTFNQAMGRFVADATRQGWKIEFFALMDDDIEMTQRVARFAGLADPVIHCEYANPERFMARVSKMEAFVGLKLHSVILAMCAHVPSIMLEYRPKGLDFMASLGLEQFNVRTSDVEPSALRALLSELIGRGAHWSEIIRKRLDDLKKLQETRARELIGLES